MTEKLIDYSWKELSLPAGARNLALSSNGAVATASTSLYDPSGAINGQRTLNGWGNGNGWQAKSEKSHPNWWGDWLQIAFRESQLMDTVVVHAFPEHALHENRHGLENYTLQICADDGWENIETVKHNTKGIIVHRFSERSVKNLRLWITQRDARVIEVEAYHLESGSLWVEERRQVRITAGKGTGIAILRDEFPAVAHNSPSCPESLAESMRSAGYDVTFLDGRDITSAEVLNKQNFALFVHPYGSVFPLGSALCEYLSTGGHLLAVGGHAFTEALQWENGRWVSTGWDPGLTVSVTEKADWFIQQRDQLTLFGAPGHSLNDVAYIAVSPNQSAIQRMIKRDGEITGPSAAAVVGDVSPLTESGQAVREGRKEAYVQKMRLGISRGRNLPTPGWFTHNNHPLLAQPCSRWLPLVSAYDRYGRIRGTVGAALLHYDGVYKGSRWAYFGANNVDLFAPDEALREALPDILRFLLNGLTLHTVLSDLDCYRVGESAKLSAIVDNAGQLEQTAELTLSVFPANGGECVHVYRENLVLMPGAWRMATTAWRVEHSDTDLYRVQASLLVDGEPYDSEEFGFVVWNDRIVASGPKLDYEHNYFSINGERRFLTGVRDDGFHMHGQAKENALWWDRQFAMIRDYGQDVFSPVYVSVFVPGFGWGEPAQDWIPEKLLRIIDAQVQLTQKHGVVMGITVFFVGQDEAIYKPEISRKLCATLGTRYKNAPGIMFYIFDDGYREDPGLFNSWARECRAGFNESGRKYLVTAEWCSAFHNADTHRDGSREMDFVSISCYHGVAEYPEQTRLSEMRAIGKNFTNAEFGRQVPAGSLTDKHVYLAQPHHQFGMGHAMTINWKWKDNDHAIFPWGVVYPGDWVPKDELYLYRNSALLFRQFQPAAILPPVVVLLPRAHLALDYKKVHPYLLELLGLLLDRGVDYTVIDEIDLDRLPDTTRAVLYPIPYRAPEQVYLLLEQFVHRGGFLWLAGGDEALAEETVSSDALKSLIGARFDGWLGSDKGRLNDAASLRAIKGIDPLLGSMEYPGKPNAKVIPAGAQVVAADEADEAVVLLNNHGRGATLYSTDSTLGGANATLSAFLGYSGVSWRRPNPQGVRIFNLPCLEATVYTLASHRWDECSRTVELPTRKHKLDVTLGTLGVGVVAINNQDEVCAFEGAKLMGNGEVWLKSTAHIMISAIGFTDIFDAAGLLLMPSEQGVFSLRTAQPLTAVTGSIENGRWITHENIDLDRSEGWSTLCIDRTRSRSLILLSTAEKIIDHIHRIEQLCKK